MKNIASLILLTWVATFCLAQDQPSGSLPRSTPEEQGVSSHALLQFVEEADKKIDVMNSIMIVRHGQVITEGWWAPYDSKTRHELYSLSKSFTSTAVGLAITEGKLSLDDQVLKFFPDDAPAEPSNNLKNMRVRDLLCMSTGHQSEPALAASTQPWTKTFLAHPVPHKPGTHFMYNTPATYMLSAIVQKVTGKTVLEYLQPRLFEPLGIQNPTWGMSPQGTSLGGYGLNVRTEDIAKFGQLYLQKGKWGERQLLPATWVTQATSRQTSNGSSPSSDWDQGYGYQFWRCRHGCYRGDGAFGQFCIVMPEQDAVVVVTSGVKDMQAILNLVWDKLLPEMKAGSLSADSEGLQKLKARLASLSVPVLAPSVADAVLEKVSGKKYQFPANDQKIEKLGVELNKSTHKTTLSIQNNGSKEQTLICGEGNWEKCRLSYCPFPEQEAAVCGSWKAKDVFTVKVCFYETPFILTLTMKFSDSKLSVETQRNVGFGSTRQKELVGKSE